MSWTGIQLYSDVASRLTPIRRAACPSVARLQSAGAGSILQTKRSLLGANISVDTYSYITATAVNLCQNTKYRRQDNPTALATSNRRQMGSYAQCSALGASLRGARPQQQQFCLGVGSNLCRHNKSVFFAQEDCFDLRFSQLRMRSGQNLELKKI